MRADNAVGRAIQAGTAPAAGRAPRRGILPGLLAVLLFVVSGCSSIPTAGPVGSASADTGSSSISNNFVLAPPGPEDDASPAEIISGFINAGTGAADDYSVAREFLTDSLANTWSPVDRVVIYAADPRVVPAPDPNTFQIQLEVVGSVDAQGIRTDAPQGTTEVVPVEVAQEDGNWRVSAAPDGVMVSEVNFPLLFLSHNLYFYSSNYKYWVPDTRWFLQRSGVAANVVNSLLAGPAPYLQGAVISAFPAGTALARDAVPVISGVATVDFSAEVLQESSDLNRQQMLQQLRQNLIGLNNVHSVNMTVNQRSVDLGRQSASLTETVENPSVGATQVALYQDELIFFREQRPVPIDDVPAVSSYKPRDPAVSHDLTSFAFLNGDRTELLSTARGQQEIRVAASGSRLTAPSIDEGNWLWTAGAEGSGSKVLALPLGGEAEASAVTAPWLEDLTISEFRVSRDGSRAVLVADDAGRSRVLVTGIVRDQDGRPLLLTQPVDWIPAGDVTRAKWVSQDSVVALEQSPDMSVTPTILSPGQPPESIAPLSGITGLSAGNGAGEIFVQTQEAIFGRVGNSSWLRLTEGIRDPAFPG